MQSYSSTLYNADHHIGRSEKHALMRSGSCALPAGRLKSTDDLDHDGARASPHLGRERGADVGT